MQKSWLNTGWMTQWQKCCYTLTFVILWTCLWQDQRKGFLRVSILTVSLQLYIPRTFGQATFTILQIFPLITLCPYQWQDNQVSYVNHLWHGFVDQLPITYPDITNHSGLSITVSEPWPILFWRWWNVFSMVIRPELKGISEWGQHNFPTIDNQAHP